VQLDSDCYTLTLSLAAVCLIICASSRTSAQQPERTQQTPRDSSVIRMSVDLVQIDATVTDQKGRAVTDLTPADFEVLQDGKRQTISTFTYVSTRALGPANTASEPTATATSASSSVALRPLTAAEVRRTIAIVVDDLRLSFESIARVRNVLRRFVDEQVRPGDLVAILRTGAGMGALQQFTTDRRLLHAAVDGVRWNMQARVAPFEAATGIDTRLEGIEIELASAATLGAIRYVIRGVAPLPGRKSILLLSDGFRLTDADRSYGRVLDALRSLVDASNRAGVVLYGIDMRGLATTSPTASDGNEASPIDLLHTRARELFDTQEGVRALAEDVCGHSRTARHDIRRER
jgi:VWFA-related protein